MFLHNLKTLTQATAFVAITTVLAPVVALNDKVTDKFLKSFN